MYIIHCVLEFSTESAWFLFYVSLVPPAATGTWSPVVAAVHQRSIQANGQARIIQGNRCSVCCVWFIAGLMFLTRLPCPKWCDHHPAYLMRSMCYFPIIGAVIGAWGAVFYNAAAVILPASVSAGVSTLATVWLTGCFHEDGLADCFDGFGGGWGRTQILRIMKDSR